MQLDSGGREPSVSTSIGFFGTYFCFFLGIGVFLPYLFLFLRDMRGISEAVIGIIALLAPLAVMISQPLWGSLGDMTGRPILIIQLASVGACVTALLMWQDISYGWYFLLVPLLYGLQSAVDPLVNAAAVYVEQQGKERGVFGKKRLWGSLGFIVGNVVGAHATGYFNLGIIFPLYAGVMVLLAVQVTMLTEVNMKATSGWELLRGLIRALKKPHYRWLLLFFILWGIPFGGNSVAFGWFWKDLGGTSTGLGYLWFLAAVFEIPLYLLTVKFKDYLSLRWLLVLATIFPAVRWLLYVLVPAPWMLYFVQPIHSLMFVSFSVGAVYMVDRLSDPVIRSTGQGLLAACVYGIGSAAGNWLAGTVYEFAGGNWFYLLLVLINLSALPVIFYKFHEFDSKNNLSVAGQ